MAQNTSSAIADRWLFDPLIPLSYDLLVIDPPWRFRTWGEHNQAKSASKHYALMTLDEIKALPVNQLAQADCLMLLWATGAMLPQAFDVMKAWGFTYKSMMVWRKVTVNNKVRMGTGYWARSMHEPILIGSIGKPRKFSAFPSIFDGIAREHSRKPDEFYGLVNKHSKGMRGADVFSRGGRPGFDCWGNESTKFDTITEEPDVHGGEDTDGTLETAARRADREAETLCGPRAQHQEAEPVAGGTEIAADPTA